MASDHCVDTASVVSSQRKLLKYITRNSVYYVQDDVCRQVRERSDDRVRSGHVATLQRVVACVRWDREGGHDVVLGELPRVGDSLLLGERKEQQLLTSAVRRIEAHVL